MPTNDNINYGPAPLPGTAPAPVLGNNIDRGPAAVPAGPATGSASAYIPPSSVVPVVERPVVISSSARDFIIPVTEQAVDINPINTPAATPNATNQQRYITVLANGVVITNNATTLNFTGNGVSVSNLGTSGANIVISGSSGSNYSNSNVSAFLAAFGSNTILTTGNITGGYFIGNGSQLTGLPATYGNANVVANLASLGTNPVSTTGNVTAGNVLTGALVIANGEIQSGTGFSTGGYLSVNGDTDLHKTNVTGNLSATGNITGNYILGNGSQLTGLPATYGNANVVANLAALGTNPVSTTGNVTAGYFIGNGSTLTSIAGANVTGTVANATYALTSNAATYSTQATYAGTANAVAGANVSGTVANATYATSAGSATTAGTVTTAAQGNITSVGTLTSLSATGNITAGNIIANNIGNIASINLNGNASTVLYGNGVFAEVAGGSSYGNANVVANLAALGSNPISTTGNITSGNILTGGLVSATGNVTGGNVLTGGLVSATGNVQAGNIRTAGIASATGNIVTAGNFVGNGAALTNVTVSVAGNVIGTQSNVTLVAGSYNWTFDNTGNLTLPGNTFSVNYANSTQVNAVTRFEGSWTVPVGNSTQSFTVGGNETYQMWVDCNIPNGILVWNATATVTNTNVPVVGQQFAWVYNGGGTPIDFTSIPNQFIGTANAIVRSNVAPSSTTNRFDFGINNTSGGNVNVRYGWIAIS